MYEFLMRLIALPIAVLVVLGSLFGLGYIALRVINLFSGRMKHPKFGEMSYFMGVWQATGTAAGARDVVFAIPGNRTGPSEEALRLIDKVEATWKDLEPEFLRRFSQEILQSDYPEMHPDLPEVAKRMDTERLKSVTQLADISIEKAPKGDDMLVYLGFLHDWDPEHTRSLVVDRNLKVVDYGLTVGM